jgi:hypothetical protein
MAGFTGGNHLLPGCEEMKLSIFGEKEKIEPDNYLLSPKKLGFLRLKDLLLIDLIPYWGGKRFLENLCLVIFPQNFL